MFLVLCIITDWESITESIASKQASLAKWESSEVESTRISAAISAVDAPAKRVSSGGILAKLNSFIDNDPQQTRRNNISKTRDALAGLEQDEKEAREALGRVNRAVQADLDRFQAEKVADLKQVWREYALAMREYHRFDDRLLIQHRECLAAWNQIR